MSPEALARCGGALVISLAVAWAVTPLARRLAIRHRILSTPTERGVHREPIPYLGGIGILAGLLAGLALLPELRTGTVGLVIGAICVSVVGAWDDAREIRWVTKLLAQFGVAALVWAMGVRIETFSPPFSNVDIDFGVWSAPLTVLWLVAVMNAINFIDGLDGLAAGVSGIAGASFLAISIAWMAARGPSSPLYDDYLVVAVLAAALVGACLGFLRFNFHPASIFMGDCGALLLGLWLGGVAVLGAFKSTLLYLCPIVLLGLPLSDTAWAVFRRLRARQSPATADRGHIHHRVLDRTSGQRAAVLVLYSLSLLLAIVATWLGRP
jgi:UDP-GlcNAc:undecaprenyl-phosphate GlcNAc-1-phosphate transferase